MTKEEFENIINSELNRLQEEKKKNDNLKYYYKLNEDELSLKEINFQLNLIQKKIEKLNEIIEYHAYVRYSKASSEELAKYKNDKIDSLKSEINERKERINKKREEQKSEQIRKHKENKERINSLIAERDELLSKDEKDDNRLREIFKELKEIQNTEDNIQEENNKEIEDLQSEIEKLDVELEKWEKLTIKEIRQELLSAIQTPKRIKAQKDGKLYEDLATADSKEREEYIREENESAEKYQKYVELSTKADENYEKTERVIDNPLSLTLDLPFSGIMEDYKKNNHMPGIRNNDVITLEDHAWILTFMKQTQKKCEEFFKALEDFREEYIKRDIEILRDLNPIIFQKIDSLKEEKEKLMNSIFYNQSEKKQKRVYEINKEIRNEENILYYKLEKYYNIKLKEIMLEYFDFINNYKFENRESLEKELVRLKTSPIDDRNYDTSDLLRSIEFEISVQTKRDYEQLKELIKTEEEKAEEIKNKLSRERREASLELQNMNYNPTRKDIERKDEEITEDTIIENASDYYISTLQDKIDAEAQNQADIEESKITGKSIEEIRQKRQELEIMHNENNNTDEDTDSNSYKL